MHLFLFTAKNLPEERETQSHTAEQPSVQQTPAGTIIPLYLSKAFFFSKVKLILSLHKSIYMALKHI